MSDVNQLLPEKFYNYVQAGTPPNGVEEGETWYETDENTSWVYDGTDWVELSVTDHAQLTGVGASDHHSPVSVSQPLVNGGSQSLDLSLGAALHVDGNGDLDIPVDGITSALIDSNAVGDGQLDGTYPDGSVSGADLSFDPATQTELNNHVGNSTAHHAKPTSTQSESKSGDWSIPELGDYNLEYGGAGNAIDADIGTNTSLSPDSSYYIEFRGAVAFNSIRYRESAGANETINVWETTSRNNKITQFTSAAGSYKSVPLSGFYGSVTITAPNGSDLSEFRVMTPALAAHSHQI
ncbi:hypothetical protein EI982_09480 [Haloplanus rallus]|uniref:Uncharacterized protein n=1 Tax=Haloplanus rallus TaxID=1816183 RepID=A0A6B9F3L6_9EURY|nr:hypothetical protein [Haloplanus rallus]QGX95005.1 hypothetical protein EI982_09480 [Haloplanus rallus]